MFYYYGAKNRLAKQYPSPEWGVVVEPFAGSAGYSQYWRKTIRGAVLFEADERVVALWHQLQGMTSDEVRDIPLPEVGVKYEDPFMDMMIKMAATSNGVMRMSGSLACPKRVVSVWPGMVNRIAKRVDDVRTWTIIHGDYRESLPFVQENFPRGSRFTWFIDPPYSTQRTERNVATWTPHGEGYRENGLDYIELGEWVRTLPGQVIVCEQNGADWLPDFRPLGDHWDSQGVAVKEVMSAWRTCFCGGRGSH